MGRCVTEDHEPLSEVGQGQDAIDSESGRRTDRLKARAGGFASSLEGIRDSSRTVGAGFLIVERNRQFPMSLMVGALASRLVIFLIPFLFLVIFTIGFGAEQASVEAGDLADDAGIPQLFADAAADSAAASGGLRGYALVLTAFAMVWAASGVGHTLWLAFAVEWAVPTRKPHPRWAVPLVVIVVVFLGMGVYWTGSGLDHRGYIDIAVRVGEFLAAAGLWLVVSRMLPHHPSADRWRDLIPGALIVGLAVAAMKTVMVLYLTPKWGALSERYGDIGIVLVMLSWAYLIGFAAIASASVNASAFHTRGDPTEETSGWRSWPLPRLLRTRWQTRRDPSDGVDEQASGR